LPGIITNFVLLPHYFEYVFNIIILTYIIKILKGHRQEIGNFYSDIENKTLSWIRAIVFVFLFFHALWVIEDLVGILHEEITEYFAYTSNILTFLMIYWIGYNGFSQSEIFTSQQFQSYKKTTLEKTVTDIDTLRKFKEISETIYTKKIFADTDLTLRTLSITLNLKEKELSRIINKSTQKNFYHFINQFRIDEFKKLLSSPKAKQLSILGLAQEAGFSSKSTFYTAFKNIEGITPKEYQNQLKKSE
jgi:AraC-like DNA-binding protein